MKHISQREAHRNRRELARLRERVKPSSITPSPRWEVCKVTLSESQMREVQEGERFGLSHRWERYGPSYSLYVFREVSA